jgi:hypothetical protein
MTIKNNFYYPTCLVSSNRHAKVVAYMAKFAIHQLLQHNVYYSTTPQHHCAATCVDHGQQRWYYTKNYIHQHKDPPMNCTVVNAVTKVKIAGRMDPAVFEVNSALSIKDEDEFESLLVPFEILKHGLKVNI